jgi:hypothetical protein
LLHGRFQAAGKVDDSRKEKFVVKAHNPARISLFGAGR